MFQKDRLIESFSTQLKRPKKTALISNDQSEKNSIVPLRS